MLYLNTVRKQYELPIKGNTASLLYGGVLIADAFPHDKETRNLLAKQWFDVIPPEHTQLWKDVATGVLSMQTKLTPPTNVDVDSFYERRRLLLSVYHPSMTLNQLVQVMQTKDPEVTYYQVKDDVKGLARNGIELQIHFRDRSLPSKDLATERDTAVVVSLQGGDKAAAAAEMGIKKRTVSRRIARLYEAGFPVEKPHHGKKPSEQTVALMEPVLQKCRTMTTTEMAQELGVTTKKIGNVLEMLERRGEITRGDIKRAKKSE